MPVFVPYVFGVVTAPLAMKVIKPLLRGTVKTTVGIGLQAKKLAAEATEDVMDLAAEASAEMAVAETGTRSGVAVTEPKAAVTERKVSVTEQPKISVTEQLKGPRH